MKKYSHLNKKIRQDAYNLDYAFVCWLGPRLKEYLKNASKTIDLKEVKLPYKDREYTQEEAVKRMIQLIDDLNLNSEAFFFDEKYYKNINELLDLWHLWAEYLWW